MPLFTPEGDAFIPSPLTRSPWSPESLHGGAPAALMVRAIERHAAGSADSGIAMQIVRFTIDLVRPVPVTPLFIETATVRPGRRVQVVDATLRSSDAVCARMSALLLRERPVPIPEDVPQPSEPAPSPGPEQIGESTPDWPFEAFHTHGCDVRFARGLLLEPGPAFAWIRLRHPLIEGETPSPMQRVAAASDSGNGVSSVLAFDKWLFVNPDLSVHLHRQPRGEWIGLDATTRLNDSGAGAATSDLYDLAGRIGGSAQSLLVEPR